MPPVSLPDDASLEQLRMQAKDVRDLACAGVPGALDLVAEHHPKGAHPVTLTGAQLVVTTATRTCGARCSPIWATHVTLLGTSQPRARPGRKR